MSASPRPAFHIGGLDGLRAVAVVLVLVYHLSPAFLPGGFIGVDVFFVISGFLITTLLVREWHFRGRIDLKGFWVRRARRLLPALVLTLLVCSSLALLLGGDLLVDLGAQVLGSLFFASNWVLIATGTDYFTRDTPELFRNTWSLAIEEQFYIILPLLLLFLLQHVRSKFLRIAVPVVLAALSALMMTYYHASGMRPTRIYFGLDSHVFGLFLGAGAAILMFSLQREPREGKLAGFVRLMVHALWFLLGCAALAALVYLAFTLEEASSECFTWGFQLATLCALLVVLAATRPNSPFGKLLDFYPLRWVGERSYGIYLWHWPVMLITSHAFYGQSILTIVFTLLITIAAATLSYMYVEMPLRRLGFRGAFRAFYRAFTAAGTGLQRVVAISLSLLLLVTLPATVAAALSAPNKTSAESAIARGAEALHKQKKSSAAKAKPQPVDPTKLPRPLGTDISAVGDSVMLASAPELTEHFPGISVDAAVSRSMYAGDEIIRNSAAAGSLRRIVVVGLATNGTVEPKTLESILASAAGRHLILVNAHGDRTWIPVGNQTLADFAAAHRGVVVAAWDAAISAQSPDLLAGDGIHPNPSGASIYADAIAQALAELQTPAEAVGFGVPMR